MSLSGLYTWGALNSKAAGIEGGYFILRRFGDRGMISLDSRMRFARVQENSDSTVLLGRGFFMLDTIRRYEYGTLNVNYFGAAFPFKLRYEIWQKQGIYFLLGLTPSFNLQTNSQWQYTELVRNTRTGEDISRTTDLEREVDSEFFHFGRPVVGAGIKKKSIMLEAVSALETVLLEDSYLTGFPLPTIMLTVNYLFNDPRAEAEAGGVQK